MSTGSNRKRFTKGKTLCSALQTHLLLMQLQCLVGSCRNVPHGTNVFWPKTALPRCKQVVRATLNGKAQPIRFQAKIGTHDAFAAANSIASIDVEFAHFGSIRTSVTAAAEVCLLAGDGTTLWHSFIRPGRLLIGYGLSKDLTALGVNHPKSMQKDLIKYKKFSSRSGKQARRLQDVAHQFLGYKIQGSKHSAREDAYAALQLYLLHIKNDPDLMTFQELVDFELSLMQLKATSDDDE